MMLDEGVCLVFALARESLFFWRHCRCIRRIRSAPCRAWHVDYSGDPLLILQTGVGSGAIARGLRWALNAPWVGGTLRYMPDRVVLAGFSGALTPDLRLGDLILANEVTSTSPPWHCTLQPPKTPLRTGRILTVPELIASPEQKARLWEQFQALAVDMESAAAARLCQEAGVSFTCLRAISDDGKTALSPRLVEVLQTGSVSVGRLLGAVLRQPGLIAELWRLARDTRLAARQLADALVTQVLAEGVSAEGSMQRIT